MTLADFSRPVLSSPVQSQLELFADTPPMPDRPKGGRCKPIGIATVRLCETLANAPASDAPSAPEPLAQSKPEEEGPRAEIDTRAAGEPQQERVESQSGAAGAYVALEPASTRRAPERLRVEIDSLADVLSELEAVPVPTGKHGEMRSALKMVGKAVGRPLRDISAAPPELAKVLDRANPAAIGMTRLRWTRVRSLLRAALAETGVEVMPGRDIVGLAPTWRELFDRLPNKKLKCGLSRLLSWLSRTGVQPSEVDEPVLERFKAALLGTSLDPAPLTSFNSTARLWNKAAETVEGWPRAVAQVQPDPKRYSLAWAALPEAFVADLEAFLHHGGNQNPVDDDYAPSVREATIENRRQILRQFASALVGSGFPVSAVTSLAVLVDPDNARRTFRHLMARNDGKVRPQIANTATLLRTVSRHWVKAPAESDKVLARMVAGIQKELGKIAPKGMKPKNRERLRQFELVENQKALLLLPSRIFEEVRRKDKGGKGEAVRAMMALAVELLLVAPMRVRNLTGLEVDRHLKTVRRGGKVSRHIEILEDETKTGAHFEMALPPESAALLDIYLEKYRPRVCRNPGPFLFPGRGGKRRIAGSFGALLSKFIARETGLKMNPHLFRHLAAKLHLKANPQDIETVRRVLGHTTTRTTLRAYADLQSAAAFRHYDQTIADLRDGAARVAAKASKTSARLR